MRATRSVGGIKRIFPLIKQHAPECITQISSFSAFPPKSRLAIDATLLVQRLHFSPDQHPDRHALGFSRLIRQLREFDLIPIMVFDNFGQQARLPAKSREHERRRSQRYVLALRAKIEIQRAKRLRELHTVLESYKSLTNEDRGKVTRLLHGWREDDRRHGDWMVSNWTEDSEGSDTPLSMFGKEQLSHADHKLLDTMSRESLENMAAYLTSTATTDDEHTVDATPSVWSEILQTDRQAQQVKEDSTGGYAHGHWNSLWSQVLEVEQSSAIQVAARIQALRRQFGVHLARTRAATSIANELSSEWPRETPAQSQMTRSESDVYTLLEDGSTDVPATAATPQQATEELQKSTAFASLIGDDAALTGETIPEQDKAGRDSMNVESEFVAQEQGQGVTEMAALSQDSPTTGTPPSTEDSIPADQNPPPEIVADDMAWLGDLDDLSERSAHMQRNYVRSSTSLAQSAFESCASLCETLDVPVLWTGSGAKGQGRPHEAEAMASMLVRHGYADVVVSEDSDVILYDVPLLRGIMGSRNLELVDSSRLRRKLFPPARALLSIGSIKRPMEALTESNELENAEEDEQKVEAADELLQEVPNVEMSSLGEEQRAEEASKRQMLDFALLCGTDFNRTLPGIAAARALKLVQEFGSIDGIRRASANITNSVGKGATTSKTPGSKHTSATLSAVTPEGALKLPDDLSWREYSKELTQARHVFENPPTLFWQLRKIRDLKRENDDPHAIGQEENLHAVQSLLERGNRISAQEAGYDESERSEKTKKRARSGARSGKKANSSSRLHSGFGATPFGDERSVVSWP